MNFYQAVKRAVVAGSNIRRKGWPPSRIELVDISRTYQITHQDLEAEDWELHVLAAS